MEMKKKQTEPWVTINIQTHGNSVVPPELIKEHGIETTEKLISYASGVRVKITERHPLIDVGNDTTGHKYEMRKKPFYVAEVVQKTKG